MKLNPQQDAAVKFIGGPCLVLAGAGSGKTRVIINKIAYLIQECELPARHIAAVTFTNKAAREMRERINAQLPKSATRGLTISTFHTLGLEILKKEYRQLGYKANFSLFDDQDSFALLKELTAGEYNGDKELIRKLQNRISSWKNDLTLPELALQQTQDAELRQLACLIVRDQSIDHFVDFTFDHPVELVERQVDPVVGHPPLREVIGSDPLGPIARADLALAVRRAFAVHLLALDVVEPGAQYLHRLGAVLVLRLFRRRHDQPRRQVRDTHGRVGRVDVLAAGARRTIGIDAAIAFVDLDVDRVIDHRIDPDRREGRVAAGV